MKDTENLKQDYLLNIPIDLLAKKYNTTENAIRLRMSKLKIKRSRIQKSDKITINDYQKDIIQDYQKLSIKKISKKYKFDERTIANFLKRNNIEIKELTNQIYTIDENYFDIIDSEDKAYFLGLLYADGWHTPEKYYVGIELQEEDSKILEIFNINLKSNKPLMYRTRENINHKNTKRLSISNKKISFQLMNKGLVQAKSLILTFPTEDQVPSYLHNHFIRGYFDGDGCVHLSKRFNKLQFSLEGTEMFLKSIQQIFLEKEINILKLGQRRKGSKTFNLNHSKKSDIKILYNYLYQDATIYLERKYEKFKNNIRNEKVGV